MARKPSSASCADLRVRHGDRRPNRCRYLAVLLVPVVLLAWTATAHGAQGTITTVAGGGSAGDGGPATESSLRQPRRVEFLPGGDLLVVEFGGAATYGDGRVRKVAADGTITTVAGDGVEGFAGDGGPAVAARMSGPTDVVALGDGGFLIADEFNHRVRRVSADGTISTVAGAGGEGCGPQSGRALDARLTWVRALSMEPGGASYLLLDENCSLVHRVRAGDDDEIGTRDDTIATVAGRGGDGFSGDGGPATSAQLHAPRGVAALPGGGFLIADSLNARVRRVGPDGVIRTVAGTGENRFGLDGGLAAATPLSIPRDVEAVPGGGFLIAESGTHRIRWVAPNGVITTLAGTGTRGTTGDGGPGRSARLATPFGVNMSPEGDVYVSGPGLDDPDPTNYRVRRIEGPLPAAPPLPTPTTPTVPGPTQPAPPVESPSVEAPPVPAPARAVAPGAVAPAVAPAPPFSIRLTVAGSNRVRAGSRVRVRLRSATPMDRRTITVERARLRIVRGRLVARYRAVALTRPAGTDGGVTVLLPVAGVHRIRVVWTDAGVSRGSAPVTIVARRRAATSGHTSTRAHALSAARTAPGADR